jgi:hypothetical protein
MKQFARSASSTETLPNGLGCLLRDVIVVDTNQHLLQIHSVFASGLCQELTSLLLVEQDCKLSCFPGQYMKGSCSGQGTYDGIECVDCPTSCDSGMYMQGQCTGMETVNSVECYPCPAGTYSERSGQGVSSCLPCPIDSYSDPGASTCTSISRGWALQSTTNEYRSGGVLSTMRRRRAVSVTFVKNVQGQNRIHPGVARFDGSASSYIEVQDSDGCQGLPEEGFSVSLWVRLEEQKRSGFIGCFENQQQGALGWFLGTSAAGTSFAFTLRTKSSSEATLLLASNMPIEPRTW